MHNKAFSLIKKVAERINLPEKEAFKLAEEAKAFVRILKKST